MSAAGLLGLNLVFLSLTKFVDNLARVLPFLAANRLVAGRDLHEVNPRGVDAATNPLPFLLFLVLVLLVIFLYL